MSESARAIASPYLDEPIRRLVWIVPAAMLLWASLLIGFAHLLERTAPPPPELKAVEARIVELPPAVGGLHGGSHAPGAPAAKPKVHREAVKPLVHHHRVAVRRRRVKPLAPLAPASPTGTAKGEAPPTSSSAAPSSASATGGNKGGGGVPGGKGSGGGSGLGSDSAGARAIFAPLPKIPDDLRENAFQALAVARFKVSSDGKVDVTLIEPTANPRLNEVLLATLKQWRFFPAMRDGVAIDSQFDVRIPIVVR
jgi:periplasmic protein TonB